MPSPTRLHVFPTAAGCGVSTYPIADTGGVGMEPPQGWRPLQGDRAPLQVRPTTRLSRHQPDRPAPLAAGQRADGPRTMPRCKRFVLMHVLPVCVAMAWQLGVVIGLLGVFLIGLILLRLL